MSPWINYHHLLYFKTIAEEKSVSKAATKLKLGQPSLSAQLKTFEENLGVQLFERQHKKLILTEQGQLALSYAQNIFKMGNEMYEALHDRLAPSRIHLQIAALDSIPKPLILQISQKAYQLASCQITLVEGRLEEMLRELAAHRVDLLVTNFLPSSPETKGFIYKSITKSPVSIYGSSAAKSLRKGFPKSLSSQKFVLPTYDSQLRYDVEHWAKQNQITMDIVAETQDISLKQLMAAEGLGLIPAAPHHVDRQLKSKELIQIGELTGVSEELFLVAAQRRVSNPLAAKLMKSFTVAS